LDRADAARHPHHARRRPIIREIQASGVRSYRAIAGALNARGIPTALGGDWHDSTVRNALKHAQ
jgi:hypothetical protein